MTERDHSRPGDKEREIMTKQLKLIERGGQVKRYHTVPTIKTELVASHSFVVAWCVRLLSEGVPKAELLLAALQHDNAEFITGDLPAPTKQELKITHQFDAYERQVISDHYENDFCVKLTKEEHRMLKFADICAGLLFCVQERAMGNMFIDEPFGNYWRYAEEVSKNDRTAKEKTLLDIIQRRWNYATGNK